MTSEDDDRLLNNKDIIQDNKSDELAKWSKKVKERYGNLHKVVFDNLPNLWPALEFALSVKTILNIKIALLFAGIILGSSC